MSVFLFTESFRDRFPTLTVSMVRPLFARTGPMIAVDPVPGPVSEC